MLRDVFYFGQKPNAHPKEKFAKDLIDARSQSRTEDFWIINEFCDYRNFDWEFDFDTLPDEDVWAKEHNNIWPSQHQKDSGTWLCPKKLSQINVYRNDVQPVQRKNIKATNWILLDKIDESKFDFSWHPDPTDPPYIYKWGCKYFPVELQACIEYRVENAIEIKYMPQLCQLLPSDNLKEYTKIDRNKFDLSWRPDPLDPPYIYVWGNKYDPAEVKPTLEYHSTGATDKKYMGILDLEPEWDRWKEHQKVKNFDYSWRPDPNLHEDPYIYVWGNKWVPGEIKPTLEYCVPNATQRKYMPELLEVEPENNRWTEFQKVDWEKSNKNDFDLSWRPDPREPPFIYVWGNKYIPGEIAPTLEYTVPGATQKKYMDNLLIVKPQLEHWHEIVPVDKEKSERMGFDFSWRPNPTSPPYIYVWGNRFEDAEYKHTLEYRVPSATEIKYMSEKVEVLPQTERWKIFYNVDKTKFDFSWRPDPREPAYIYVWGNKWIPGELSPTIEYHMPGATEKKYLGDFVTLLPNWENWVINHIVDIHNFDFTWLPDPREPAFIYVWGNKHIPGEIQSTIEYHVPNAEKKKYLPELVPLLPEIDKWKVTQQVSKNFDFTWRPDPREPAFIYVWGNKWIPGEIKPTLEYYCTGATERKYMGIVDVEPEYDRYKILIPIDKTSFDFTWRPDPREPAYIYVWGNQYNSSEIEPTIEYHCEDATERKYLHDVVAKTLPDIHNWKILIPVDEFDFTWRPDPGSPPYIYVFGNQWHDAMTEPTLEYHVPTATERKYITNVIAKVSASQENWKTLLPIESFDYSWRPNPHSSPYIYVFGNQWNNSQIESTIEYHQPGATDKKYIEDIIAIVKSTSTKNAWKKLIPVESFDYSWRPDPGSPPYIYVFGNKWNDAATEPSIEYHVEGATEYKYINDPVVMPKVEFKNWIVNNLDDLETFDFSWRPNPHSPPHIYQWENNGPRYTVPGATDVILMTNKDDNKKKVINRYYIKTNLEDLIEDHKNEVFWALNPELNYDDFDFNWKPNQENFMHINVFGTELSKNLQTYYVNAPLYVLGYRQFNYISIEGTLETNLSMFYVDRGNISSTKRFENLKEKYPEIQKTRYLNSWVDTISRCVSKSKTKYFWILSSELDYSEFTFDFYPSPWQEKMIHVFGTQWSHWGNTYLINKETFVEDTKYVKIIEHLSNLNFVKTKRAKATDILHDTILINFGNLTNEDSIDLKNKNVKIVDFDESYLKTFKNIVSMISEKKEHYIWIISSVCNYSSFDFTYICDPFARDQLHVFPSNFQKYGDTFFVNVNKLRELISSLEKLEDFKINFNATFRVERLSPPKVIVDADTFTNINLGEINFPYAEVVVSDNIHINSHNKNLMCLWSEQHKSIIVNSEGSTNILLPTNFKQYVTNELYDYPNIKKIEPLIKSKPLDIVFLSNGEINCEENFEHLLDVTRGLKNNITRVKDIKGRVNAYHAAANMSKTNWFFTVFGKLKINENFDWDWQPDRLQVPKHYIFHATNPVNDLEYGHQAMIAYNKKLTLKNTGKGLDFTLDDKHEVVELNSGIANYNTDPYSTWRTAFREVLKLRVGTDFMSQMRLHAWLTKGNGNFGEWSINGANDAYEYFDEVEADFSQLKLSYEWQWLNEYFTNKYKL